MPNDLEALDRIAPVLLDSYFVVDEERKVRTSNAALAELSGLRRAQRRSVGGKKCYELLQLEICQERCIALECLKRNGPVRMEEVRGQNSQGRELVLELSAIPMRNDAGGVEGVLVTHRDVTDERRLKSRFEEQREENQREREVLLKIIKERDTELGRLKGG